MRLSWIQPEDLVGHELRQAREDGRQVRDIGATWQAAGGNLAPPRAGASGTPASEDLRALALTVLDELAAIPSPLAELEPTTLDVIERQCPQWTEDLGIGVGADYAERLHAAWLGRAAGCLLGKPVEKIPRAGIGEIARATGNWPIADYFTAIGLPEDIAERWPWNRRSKVNSLAENINGMPEDDDLNYPLLGLLLIQRYGKNFRPEDVAQLWLDELPAGRTFTAERIAYRNLLLGIAPPGSARHHNPFREWIGAQIRGDIHGWIHPGRPGAAARSAWRDAVLSHTGNGVYGAMFVAALTSAAAVLSDPRECLRIGLSVVPPRSRLAEAVEFGMRRAERESDWERVVDQLDERYGELHWVHAVNNAAVVAAAIVHGAGDFSTSVCRTVSAGLDTDSNGATVGAVVGMLGGAVPDHWATPLHNRLSSSVAGFDGIGFDALAETTLECVRSGK